jgi:hypothetical protein
MSNITTRTLISIFLTAAASTTVAQNSQGQNGNNQGQNYQGCTTCIRAPEIDPAQALGALTLLGGAVAILRGFGRKNK